MRPFIDFVEDGDDVGVKGAALKTEAGHGLGLDILDDERHDVVSDLEEI